MADELPKLNMSASGKRLARKSGLKSMTNTHAWDAMMNDFTGTNHSKTMSVKDVGVSVGRKESKTRQLLQRLTESNTSGNFHGSTYHTECGHTSRCRCNCNDTRTVSGKCFACTMGLKRSS